MSLKEYRQKRVLGKTPEPGPAPDQKNDEGYLVFVVHKHAARRLHYDLRLEMEGVLKSFAIPKGPSLDPSVKRLAVHVEDHPFAYKDFEGSIPQGNYGAGAVIIWDKGFYGSPFSKDKKEGEGLLLKGLEKGDLKFVLAGSKLKGEFALVKTGWDEKSWLLLKKKDKYTSADDVLKLDSSVFSGKTVDELSDESHSKQLTPKAITLPTARDVQKPPENLVDKAPISPMPRAMKPMQPMAIKKPFNHADWIFEVKWDGYRAIAEIDEKSVALHSRNGLSLVNKFPSVAASLQQLGFRAVLDGEIIVADNSGIPDFQKLQHYNKSTSGHLIYYVFDILFYQGKDLTSLPLIQRKDLLKTLLPLDEHIKYSEHIWNDGESFFNAAKQKGIEGIVAKHSRSVYKPGTRTKQWLKIKNRFTLDCVIVGFTAPRGARKYLGTLVLGAYNKGSLVYIGHSGGGFDAQDLNTMYKKLRPLVRKTCPFATKPPEDSPVTWVKPTLVCEVSFTGWTKDAVLRQPEFLRMRDDKTPEEAVVLVEK
jgi:bifunctional non-homologous end joining protein LigD